MKFLVELTAEDNLSDLEHQVGVQLGLRVIKQFHYFETDDLVDAFVEGMSDEQLITVANVFLKSWCLTSESMIIELDGTSSFEVQRQEKQANENADETQHEGVVRTVRIPSSSRNMFHTVGLDKNGNALECTCEAGQHGKRCKHLAEGEKIHARIFQNASAS